MKLTYQNKLIIDHILGSFFAWCLNITAQILAPILKRDHSLNKKPENIVITKFVGIGSIVKASFLLSSLKKRYPDTKIIFLTFKSCENVVKLYSEIDQVIIINDQSIISLFIDTFKFIIWSWKNKIDILVDLEVHAKFSSIISALSLGQNRIGFAGNTSRFRRGLYSHLVFWNPTKNVKDNYIQLGKILKIEKFIESPILNINLNNNLENFWENNNLNNFTVIGINPNASDLSQERKWPESYTIALINTILKTENIKIVLTGSKNEFEFNERIIKYIDDKKKIINSAGVISFESFINLLKKLNLFITNDSGPLHLANLYNIPTISLWGPTNPNHYTCKQDNHVTIYKPVFCSPCLHNVDRPPCGGDNICMKYILPEDVLAAVTKFINLKNHQIEYKIENSNYKIHGYWKRDSVEI